MQEQVGAFSSRFTSKNWLLAKGYVEAHAELFHETPSVKVFLKKTEFGARSAAYGMKASGAWLLGSAGSGKSTLLRVCHRRLLAAGDLDSDLPCLLFTLLPAPTIHSLVRDLLTALKYPFANARTFSERAGVLFDVLKALRVRVILFDEAHHIVEGNRPVNLREIRDFLKRLLDSTNVCLVLAGLESLKKLREGDEQLASRLPAEVTLKTSFADDDGREIAERIVSDSSIKFTSRAKDLLSEAVSLREKTSLRHFSAVVEESIKIAALSDAPEIDEAHVRHAISFVFLTSVE